MIETLAAVAITTALSLNPGVASVHTRAPHRPLSAYAAPASVNTWVGAGPSVQQSSKDPLRNGMLIGGITGGLLGALGGSVGCGAGEILNAFAEEEASCGMEAAMGALAGGALGALLGAGVDAMFDQGPSPAGMPAARRRGIRLHWRF